MRKFNLWLVNNSTGHQLVCRLEKDQEIVLVITLTPPEKREKKSRLSPRKEAERPSLPLKAEPNSNRRDNVWRCWCSIGTLKCGFMFKRSQYPSLSPTLPANGGWQGTTVAFFLPPLCCRSRQSRICLAGQTGATSASQHTMSQLEHSGKDFDTPNPTPAPSPNHHQLPLFNYTLSYSRLRAWMPQVPSSRSAWTDVGWGWGVRR